MSILVFMCIVCVRVCVFVCAYTCVYMRVYVCKCVYVNVRVFFACLYVYVCACMPVYVRAIVRSNVRVRFQGGCACVRAACVYLCV